MRSDKVSTWRIGERAHDFSLADRDVAAELSLTLSDDNDSAILRASERPTVDVYVAFAGQQVDLLPFRTHLATAA